MAFLYTIRNACYIGFRHVCKSHDPYELVQNHGTSQKDTSCTLTGFFIIFENHSSRLEYWSYTSLFITLGLTVASCSVYVSYCYTKCSWTSNLFTQLTFNKQTLLRSLFLIKYFSSGWSSKSPYTRWYSWWCLASRIVYKRRSGDNGG